MIGETGLLSNPRQLLYVFIQPNYAPDASTRVEMWGGLLHGWMWGRPSQDGGTSYPNAFEAPGRLKYGSMFRIETAALCQTWRVCRVPDRIFGEGYQLAIQCVHEGPGDRKGAAVMLGDEMVVDMSEAADRITFQALTLRPVSTRYQMGKSGFSLPAMRQSADSVRTPEGVTFDLMNTPLRGFALTNDDRPDLVTMMFESPSGPAEVLWQLTKLPRDAERSAVFRCNKAETPARDQALIVTQEEELVLEPEFIERDRLWLTLKQDDCKVLEVKGPIRGDISNLLIEYRTMSQALDPEFWNGKPRWINSGLVMGALLTPIREAGRLFQIRRRLGPARALVSLWRAEELLLTSAMGRQQMYRAQLRCYLSAVMGAEESFDEKDIEGAVFDDPPTPEGEVVGPNGRGYAPRQRRFPGYTFKPDKLKDVFMVPPVPGTSYTAAGRPRAADPTITDQMRRQLQQTTMMGWLARDSGDIPSELLISESYRSALVTGLAQLFDVLRDRPLEARIAFLAGAIARPDLTDVQVVAAETRQRIEKLPIGNEAKVLLIADLNMTLEIATEQQRDVWETFSKDMTRGKIMPDRTPVPDAPPTEKDFDELAKMYDQIILPSRNDRAEKQRLQAQLEAERRLERVAEAEALRRRQREEAEARRVRGRRIDTITFDEIAKVETPKEELPAGPPKRKISWDD